MVWSSSTAFQKTYPTVRISSGGSQHAVKIVPGKMVGTGAGHKRPPRAQHLQRAQIELFIATQGAGHGTLGFGKSGRVKHHRVEGVARGAPVAEKIECVGLDPLNRGLDTVPVDLQVFFRYLERRPGGVNARHPGTESGQVQGKTALIGADIEGLATSVARRGGVVQALVEKSSGLLPGVGVVVESQPVDVKDGGQLGNGLGGVQRRLGRLAELLQFANAGGSSTTVSKVLPAELQSRRRSKALASIHSTEALIR